MQEIGGKVALVTGAGSGIGRALALALAAEGAAVAVADILPEGARAVANEIQSQGGRACWVACDVSDRDSVKRMKADMTDQLGAISLLFANAGATSFDRLNDMTENDVDWVIQVNLMGVTNCVMAFMSDMIARREGHLCATASMAGLMPGWVPNHAPYSAAKMGVIGLMLNLRMELQQHNVGCTAYCPGGVATGMKANNSLYRPSRFGGPSESEIDLGDFTPPSFLAPEEVAPMVLRAVKKDRPLVVDHASQREFFQSTYVDVVMSAFDDIAAYERGEA